MGIQDPKDRSKPEITDSEATILLLIAYWINGNTLLFNGDPRQIATHRERPLNEMFQGTGYPDPDSGRALKYDVEYSDYKDVHRRMLDRDLLREEYVCRRKIDWVPTERGLRAINEYLEPWSDVLRPDWASSDDMGPLFGDPNEGLLHRKGVEIMARVCRCKPWTDDGTTRPDERPTKEHIDWYPTDKFGNACHDLHISTVDYAPDLGVEVITQSNNYQYLINKWERFSSEERNTIWIFDDRNTACKFFNKLDRENHIYLDGGQFSHSENWSAQAINNKVGRSIEDRASHRVHTINGMFNSGDEKIQKLING